MILVTGATGTVGRELVRVLRERHTPFRAMVRNPADRDALQAARVPVALADFTDSAALAAALADVDRIYLLGPPEPPHPARKVVDAARDAPVSRIVFQSAMGANDMSAAAFKRWNGFVERRLMDSGLAYTILRPTGFMQNLLRQAERIAATGVIRLPLGDARVGWIDARDIAAVAAVVLSEEGHDGRVYDLSGPEALSYRDIAAKLSSSSAREIRYESISDAEAFSEMLSRGMSTGTAGSMLSLYQAYREVGVGSVTGWVEILSRSAPRTFDSFAQEHSHLFRNPAS